MSSTEDKIKSFNYSWAKALPLFRAYLLDLGESLRSDLQKELEYSNKNSVVSPQRKKQSEELIKKFSVVFEALKGVTELMRTVSGPASLDTLPEITYAKYPGDKVGLSKAKMPYVRRGNWGGSRRKDVGAQAVKPGVKPEVKAELAARKAAKKKAPTKAAPKKNNISEVIARYNAQWDAIVDKATEPSKKGGAK